MYRNLTSLLVALALASASGCSISKSSESISKSISSPFKWSSASSSSDDDDDKGSPEVEQVQAKQAYSDDIRQLASTYAEQGGDLDALRAQVSKLASVRGISNWEADSLTCTNLAEGARTGGMNVEEQIAFSNEMCGSPANDTQGSS